VKQVRAVAVHFNPGFWLRLGVGVTAEVMASFHYQHPFVQLGSSTLSHGEAEEA
jgi:hypothetical protein